MLDPELRKEIIMEHYLNPINRNSIEDERYIKVNSNSETCIDNIDLYILFEDDKIKDFHFNGEACAISTSAASIMIKLLVGKTISEVKEIMNNYYNMINEKDYNEDILEEIEKANKSDKEIEEIDEDDDTDPFLEDAIKTVKGV